MTSLSKPESYCELAPWSHNIPPVNWGLCISGYIGGGSIVVVAASTVAAICRAVGMQRRIIRNRVRLFPGTGYVP